MLFSRISCADGLRGAILPWVARSKEHRSVDRALVRDRLPRAIDVYPLLGWVNRRNLKGFYDFEIFLICFNILNYNRYLDTKNKL